jgi:hypothetical protein
MFIVFQLTFGVEPESVKFHFCVLDIIKCDNQAREMSCILNAPQTRKNSNINSVMSTVITRKSFYNVFRLIVDYYSNTVFRTCFHV